MIYSNTQSVNSTTNNAFYFNGQQGQPQGQQNGQQGQPQGQQNGQQGQPHGQQNGQQGQQNGQQDQGCNCPCHDQQNSGQNHTGNNPNGQNNPTTGTKTGTTNTTTGTPPTAPDTTLTVNVPSTGTTDATPENIQFNFVAGDYNYTISHFTLGDKLSFAPNSAISIVNTSANDGSIDITSALNEQLVTVHLTGLDTGADGSIYSTASFNNIFGLNSLG